MSYVIELKLRDSRKEFDTEQARDDAYNTVQQTLLNWGIPERNIILSKIDNNVCNMGYAHETVVERAGGE